MFRPRTLDVAKTSTLYACTGIMTAALLIQSCGSGDSSGQSAGTSNQPTASVVTDLVNINPTTDTDQTDIPDLGAASAISATPLVLAEAFDYRVQVRSVSTASAGEWSSPVDFTFLQDDDPQVELSEEDAAKGLVRSSNRLIWTSDLSALGYEFRAINAIDGTIVAEVQYDAQEVCEDTICQLEPMQLPDDINNEPPIAVLSQTVVEGQAPLSVFLDGSQSFDAETDELAYRWIVPGRYLGINDEPTFEHVFSEIGEHRVMLDVTDESGAHSRAYALVVVSDPDPDSELPAELNMVDAIDAVVENQTDYYLGSGGQYGSITQLITLNLNVYTTVVIANNSTDNDGVEGSNGGDVDPAEEVEEEVDPTPTPTPSPPPPVASGGDDSEPSSGGSNPFDVVDGADETPADEDVVVSVDPDIDTGTDGASDAEDETDAGDGDSTDSTTDNSTVTTPVMSAPKQGSKLAGASQAITWTPNSTSVLQWIVEVGTSTSKDEYFNSGRITNPEARGLTLTGLPEDGSEVVVRLSWKLTDGSWGSENFLYKAAGASADDVNLAEGDDEVLTQATEDTKKPVISNVEVQDILSNRVSIKWDLDEYATGYVEYGTSPGYGTIGNAETSFKYNVHIQRISDLEPDTQYYFRVHSSDASGNAAVSEQYEFKTSEEVVEAKSSGSSGDDIQYSKVSDGWPANANGELPLAGIFYGNPFAGIGTANAPIALESTRRFRAERTGRIEYVRYHNRILRDYEVPQRCERYGGGDDQPYCKCVNAGLDGRTCGYTMNNYSVGNGGTIVVEMRPDDGNGKPTDIVLGKTEPFVPYDHERVWYPELHFVDPPLIEAGVVYHLVYTNLNPPTTCAMTYNSVSKAINCPRDQGAMSLNGNFHLSNSDNTNRFGPYRGDTSTGTLYRKSKDDDWSFYSKSIAYYELGYTDGVAVGDSYLAELAASRATQTIAGSARGRQNFIVRDASRQVDGLWLNYGHRANADGSSMLVQLKSSNGNVLAKGEIPASDNCRAAVNKSSTYAEEVCRDWAYLDFGTSVSLLEGSSYYVEFSAGSKAGFAVSTYQPFTSHGFTDRNHWFEAYAQISKDNGASWHEWADGWENERDMALAFTIEGMPKQLP